MTNTDIKIFTLLTLATIIVIGFIGVTFVHANTAVITNDVVANSSGNGASSVSIITTVDGDVVTEIVESSTGTVSVSNDYSTENGQTESHTMAQAGSADNSMASEPHRQKLLELLELLKLYVSLLTQNR